METTASNRRTVEWVAAAMVRFCDDAPASWEMALVEVSDVSTLEPGQFFGYGADSGTASFLSVEAEGAQCRQSSTRTEGFAPCPEVHGRSIYEMIELSSETNLNFLMFRAGVGDGGYGAYWGLAASGKLVCLATDFGLVRTLGESE